MIFNPNPNVSYDNNGILVPVVPPVVAPIQAPIIQPPIQVPVGQPNIVRRQNVRRQENNNQPQRQSRRIRGLPPGQDNLRRSSRIRALNLRGGAPYVGTIKEKHFLDISMINKFTNSPALLKTPERNMNSCLMMSLIRSQLYRYSFENNKLKSINITGTKNNEYHCDNMYVQCITNFDGLNYNFP